MAHKNSHSAPRKKGGALKIVLVLLVLLLVVAGGGVWMAKREIDGGTPGEEVPVSIQQGSGVGTIAGAYVQDGKVGFNGPLNTFVEPKSSNYYMEAWFGEQTLTGRINTIAIVLMVVMLGGLL